MRRTDPRIRQTLNQISQNIESANLSTQASIFNFSQKYLSPCLASLQSCLEASCQPCFTARDEQRRPHRNARRGREGFGFDFYDNWDEDETEWGNDELDRLLAGSDELPGKYGGMSYGSRGTRRKSFGLPKDGGADPTVVPSSSMFGFLEGLPWKLGSRGVKYRPSAADLQENVGRKRGEDEPLVEESEESGVEGGRGRHGRKRSGTTTSRSTNNSLSSRGDLLPSDDEDDAVPIDDEFAIMLGRRTTGTASDDHSSRKNRGKGPNASRASTKTVSSRGTKSTKDGRRANSTSTGKDSHATETAGVEDDDEVPTLKDLKQEEERLFREEEAEVERRRQAAQQLALQRGMANRENEASGAEEPSNVQQGEALDVPADETPLGKSGTHDPSPETHDPDTRSTGSLSLPNDGSNTEPKPPDEPA